MTAHELTDDEIQARINAAELSLMTPMAKAQDLYAHLYHDEAADAADVAHGKYRYVAPFAESADSLIAALQNTEGRFMLGLREIDLMTRGHGRGELTYITGYSHSGKTQLFLGSVVANRDKRVVLFTPDEPAELVLTKLVCMRTRSNAERLEERIKANDAEAMERVRRIARTDFANLVVIDEPIGLGQMSDALKEAEDFWGERVDAVGIDYLELLPSDESEVEKKSQELKRWTKDADVPVLCLHQGSRGNSGRGQKLTMWSMKYGGEQEAIHVIGVRRQRDDEGLDDWERQRHTNTVDVSVIKNKRPPSKKGEVTYFLDPTCGVIRTLQDGDLDAHGPMKTVEEARAHVEQIPGQASMDEDPKF